MEKRWRWGVHFLLLLMMLVLCCSCLRQVAAAAGSSMGWEWVGRIEEIDGEELPELLSPLLQMANNSMLYPNLTEIKGWRLSSLVAPLTSDSPSVHAFVYEEEDDEHEAGAQNATMKRAVVTFRGKRDDELSDTCATMMFVDGYHYSSLPSECTTSFNESTLDYLSEAISYISLALLFYPSPSLLISGHSFGGSLAILAGCNLSAATTLLLPLESALEAPPLHYEDRLHLPLPLNDATIQDPLFHHEGLLEALFLPHESTFQAPPLPHTHGLQASSVPLHQAPPLSLQEADQNSPFPVLTFAAPGTRQALCQRGLPFPSSSVVTIAHQWDHVVKRSWSDEVGLLCLYEADEPAACEVCFASDVPEPPATPAPSPSEGCSRPDVPQPAALPPATSTDCWNCGTLTHLPAGIMALVDKGVRPICNLMPPQQGL